MTDIEKKSACDGCPGDNLAGTCASITELGRCGQELRRKALAEYESPPKIHRWAVRDGDGELWLCDKKPFRENGHQFWYSDGQSCILVEESLFPEITWESEPVEVELLIRKVESTKQV